MHYFQITGDPKFLLNTAIYWQTPHKIYPREVELWITHNHAKRHLQGILRIDSFFLAVFKIGNKFHLLKLRSKYRIWCSERYYDGLVRI